MRKISIDELEVFLSVKIPSDPKLALDDSRRVTGPGLLWKKPGALVDVLISDDFDKNHVVCVWETQMRRVLDAIGWVDSETKFRIFEDGVTLAISSTMDLLYSAVFAVETGWALAAYELLGETPPDYDHYIADLTKVIALEENPALLSLRTAAKDRDIDVLCDDDYISLGHGKGSKVWAVENIPTPDKVDWDYLYNLPVALITGTNGKSTSVRLTTAIAEAAGLTAGSTSTDFVKLGDEILDYGDYSGPGGARMLLRDKRLDIAFLEVARGGILRRGLPLTEASGALVTNVAADHLGQYGVNTVEALAETKFAVARTLSKDGILVLNADDPLVVANGVRAERTVCWFSLDPNNKHIQDAANDGLAHCYFDGETIHYYSGAKIDLSIKAADIPVTMGGAAKFNIQNAMGALCLAKVMGVPDTAITHGLTNFSSSQDHNPGRCNEFTVNGAKIFVDFAHNPHAIAAIADMITNLSGNKKYLMLSHAGDRTDLEINQLTQGALTFQPDVIITAEIEGYLRGREIGVIPELIKSECIRHGFRADQVEYATNPRDGTQMILDRLKPGDLVLLLALAERDSVFDLLNEVAE